MVNILLVFRDFGPKFLLVAFRLILAFSSHCKETSHLTNQSEVL